MVEKLSMKRHRWRLALTLAVVAAAGIWFLKDPEAGGWSQVAVAQSTLSTEEFERRVRAYLLDHPEIVAEALERFEERQRAAQAKEAKAALQARADDVFRDPDSPVGGNAEGDVTLVEFFDYNCRYCRQAAPHVSKMAATDPKLRVVYKEFPILGPASVFATKAALAAHRQGKYVQLHAALMAAKDALSETEVLETAGRVGLDLQRLKVDMADPSVQAAVDRNLALGEALRINGTPAFVIGESIVPGSVDFATMERLVREAREKK